MYICTSTNVHHDRLRRVRTGDRIDRVRLSLVYLPLSSPIARRVTRPGHQSPRWRSSSRSSAPPTATPVSASATRTGPAAPACTRTPRRSSAPARRGPQRHRPGAGEARRRRRLRSHRARRTGDRRGRRRPVGPQGEAREPVAGQAARQPSRRGVVLSTSGGSLSVPVGPSSTARRSLEQGAGGINIEVGQRDPTQPVAPPGSTGRHRAADGGRGPAVAPRQRARAGRALERLGLMWLEDPLTHTTPGPRGTRHRTRHPDRDRVDAHQRRRALAADAPRRERHVQPDAPRSAASRRSCDKRLGRTTSDWPSHHPSRQNCTST